MVKDEYMPEPKYVYRFMDNEEHANAFLSGRIWVSTLSYCRRIEEDPGEGTDTYHSGMVEGHGDDPLLQHVAERAGFKIGPTVKNLTFWNNTLETIDADAWVLCTTLNSDGYCRNKFGPFGVCIAQPVKFFRAISELMQREHNAGRCTIGAVEYGPRERYGTQKSIESRSFLKPVVPFAQEEELRMLWEQFDDARTLEDDHRLPRGGQAHDLSHSLALFVGVAVPCFRHCLDGRQGTRPSDTHENFAVDRV